VYIAKRARNEAARIDKLWREQRDASDVFAFEFAEAIEHIATVRIAGLKWSTQRRPNLRRILLDRSKVHLYFEVYPDEVRIVAVWWAQRAREPKL
jgi:hypothetical protein